MKKLLIIGFILIISPIGFFAYKLHYLPSLKKYEAPQKPAIASKTNTFKLRKKVIAGITGDFPPFYFREGNQYKGATIEIVKELFSRLGYSLELESVPMNRILNGLDSGKYHISPNMTETKQRSKVAIFTQVPLLMETQDLIIRSKSNIKFHGNLRDLDHYKFGAILGWTHGPHFDNADYLHKEYRKNITHQMKSLEAGRFDIAINNKQFFIQMARKQGISNSFKVLTPSSYALPVTIAISKKITNAKQVVIELDRELLKFKKEKKYKSILKKYGF